MKPKKTSPHTAAFHHDGQGGQEEGNIACLGVQGSLLGKGGLDLGFGQEGGLGQRERHEWGKLKSAECRAECCLLDLPSLGLRRPPRVCGHRVFPSSSPK